MKDDDSSVQILLLALQISRTKIATIQRKKQKPHKYENAATTKKSLFITYPIQLHSLFHFHRIQLWLHSPVPPP
jgi:hypothetical protein